MSSLEMPWFSDWAFPLSAALAALGQVVAQPAQPVLAAALACDPDCLALGAGVAELVLAIRLSCVSANNRVVMPLAHPWARLFRGAVTVPHKPSGGLDVPALLEAIRKADAEAVVIGVPDPVTGAGLTPLELELILDGMDGILIIDGTYQEFANYDLVEAAATHDRVILVRPLTLLSQAAPVAFATGSPELMGAVRETLAPLPPLLQASVHAWLAQTEVWQSRLVDVVAARQALYRGLLQTPGLQVYPSQGNFLMLRGTAEQVAFLTDAGYPVRGVPFNGPLGDCWQLAVADAPRCQDLQDQLLQTLLARSTEG
ncbi:MAG: aminotransferase class I/II-fold pyridoxal phosphate-dependent enzyme [Candidatus Sericytochromatia bacterium]|nr:aminotransferase class I/II-fold pyridoxal phosphate-dependent enzyme [Candidatus Sericytochromatia bacterium]